MRVTFHLRFYRVSNPLIALLTLFSAAFLTHSIHAQESSEKIYFLLESRVFDRDLATRALEDLSSVKGKPNDDPWVYLSGSLAVLISGYDIGDWYSMKSFAPETADRALELASIARSIAPTLSQAHAHYARILILKGEYKKAWGILDESLRFDGSSFYPWYFRGIVSEKMRDVKRAQDYFDEAEKRVTYNHQSNLLNIHRQKVAKLSGDHEEQERLLKDNIARNPSDAIYYGNYALFLMNHKRYDEAIEYWEKAIERAPYRHAIEKLAEARRLRDSK